MDFFDKFAINSIRYATFKWGASAFWEQRDDIIADFKKTMTKDLERYLVIKDFMLIKVMFASEYEK